MDQMDVLSSVHLALLPTRLNPYCELGHLNQFCGLILIAYRQHCVHIMLEDCTVAGFRCTIDTPEKRNCVEGSSV